MITYKSGSKTSQIDFLLCRRHHLNEIQNYKVIASESVATQHKPVIDDFFSVQRKREVKTTTPKIKWWNLKDPFLKLEFKRHVIRKVNAGCEEDLWEKSSKVIKEVAVEVLGKTSGKVGPRDKETWWWSEECYQREEGNEEEVG
uniref:Uncharacterized protein n=1 Tax=Cacopsylla melanoneura TaxID=428564 RepID=A0A8D8R8S9_9HEMI